MTAMRGTNGEGGRRVNEAKEMTGSGQILKRIVRCGVGQPVAPARKSIAENFSPLLWVRAAVEPTAKGDTCQPAWEGRREENDNAKQERHLVSRSGFEKDPGQ